MQMKYISPIGVLLIAEIGGFITEIKFGYEESNSPTLSKSNSVLDLCTRELDAYFTGTLREFTVPIKAIGTTFRERVWEELKKIPYGEKISYKELAKRIENPAAIRAVGGANHHNPISIIIPCHRVIGADGSLTGYGGGLHRKKFLLELEQVAGLCPAPRKLF
jgi:methylated-DNA-[protein]-cysteine S-methyltransferase